MPMIKISYSKPFKKSFRKKIKGDTYLEEKFLQKIQLFIVDPFSPSLKTHKLSEKLEGLWSFSVASDMRVIFLFVEKEKAFFENIGTHDEVY